MVLKCNSYNFNLQSFSIIIKITLYYALTNWDYGVKCYNLLFQMMLIKLAPAIIIILSTYFNSLIETNTWR